MSDIRRNPAVKRSIFDAEGHAYFVTFSCYRRRRLLDDKRAGGIVIHFLAAQLANQEGTCLGFVVMPDHVHALVHFSNAGRLSIFMNQWKRRSSMLIKGLYRDGLPSYGQRMDLEGPIWQPKYYVFNIYSEAKAKEKLDYMHDNPVRAGLARRAQDWPHSSARWHHLKKSVGVPISWPV